MDKLLQRLRENGKSYHRVIFIMNRKNEIPLEFIMDSNTNNKMDH